MPLLEDSGLPSQPTPDPGPALPKTTSSGSPPVQPQQACSQVQATISRARALVEADTAGISQLQSGFKLEANTLANWAEMTAEQKAKPYQTAVLNLLQAAVAAPFLGVRVGDLSLPNGVASLGVGQANTLIQMLRSKGIDDPVLFSLISSAATMSGKPALASKGRDIVGAVITEFQGVQSGAKGEVAEALASVAQLGLTLMGPAYSGYTTALGAGTDTLTLIQATLSGLKCKGPEFNSLRMRRMPPCLS